MIPGVETVAAGAADGEYLQSACRFDRRLR